MAEEVTSTVKTASDGMVTIAVERYEELLSKAAEKPPVVHQNVIRNVKEVVKTPEVAASDNKVWGGSLIGIGAGLFVVGAIRYFVGVRQAAKL